MSAIPACLSHAIANYRNENQALGPFAACLDRLQTDGFGQVRDPDAASPEVRLHASGFVIQYISLALCDHRISPSEMDNILVLKRIYALDEGDLLALQRPAIASLLGREMAQILVDEHVDRDESIHQSDLQRALGLGYDQFLHLTRQMIRPLVERQLERARAFPSERAQVLRQLQGLGRVLHLDTTTMTAVWPEPPAEVALQGN
ncbi:MAG: hypothetical protein GAK31_02836 [Stenotrophomonas maltophilia]|uniref:Uncharacterized protein n=1 Tax=Stenotrophomonas maltophilia TaxID=40324 RepID=A0A7V8FEB7_STEMA|nr:MAG: hypothetical protein GAK31_02836 [Stenotrophomonas maltophilia]